MSTYPEDRKYTDEHEWISVEGPTGRVGLTRYAADALGEAVYVDLPAVGDSVVAGQACGEIESTKSVSDLIAPVSGEVTAVNEAADADPAIVTGDPHGEGWLYEVAVSDVPANLLDAPAYAALADGAGA
ncbi:glycine cleavage system protein GcvH [Georgenia sp. Z1491]|uniref:glycine cleavage system protein GcvH n=1 Tax=Georgenia sp. Z1491 TaxID=3416707 RepID=UPI003CEE9E5A